MVVFTKPNKRRKRNAKKREGSDHFIDLRFERWQVVGLSELC